jgi:hypothetical protein
MTNLTIIHNRRPPGELYDSYHTAPSRQFGTVVFTAPSSAELLNEIVRSYRELTEAKIVVNIGAAFLHPDDQLNKKKGVQLATARLKPLTFKINCGAVYDFSPTLSVNLDAVDEDMNVSYRIDIEVHKTARTLKVLGVRTCVYKVF